MEKIPFSFLEEATNHIPLEYETNSRVTNTSMRWFAVANMVGHAPGLCDDPEIQMLEKSIREIGINIADTRKGMTTVSHKTLHGMTCIDRGVEKAVAAYNDYAAMENVSNAFLEKLAQRQKVFAPMHQLNTKQTAEQLSIFHRTMKPMTDDLDSTMLVKAYEPAEPRFRHF